MILEKKDFPAYIQARRGVVSALQHSWLYLQPEIRRLQNEIIKLISDPNKKSVFIQAVDDFENNIINKIIQYEIPTKPEEVSNNEEKLFSEIIGDLQPIYGDIFYLFFGNENQIGFYKPDSLPESVKFRHFNLDKRYPKDGKKNNKFSLDNPSWNTDNGKTLHKDMQKRGELYQGYFQVESMIDGLRNLTEHWKKKTGRDFLQNKLKRKMIDPVTGIQSPGNIFSLVSISILMSYQIIEILQTWIDTDTFTK